MQRFDTSGNFISQFGGSGTTTGKFATPSGIVVDTSGNIFVADTGNNRVQKFTPAGVFSSTFGTTGTGTSQFKQPFGIALDSSSNIYVSEIANNRLQKFTSAGIYTATLAIAGAVLTGGLHHGAAEHRAHLIDPHKRGIAAAEPVRDTLHALFDHRFTGLHIWDGTGAGACADSSGSAAPPTT